MELMRVAMTENEAIDKLKNMRLFMQIEDNKNECKFKEDDYMANKMAIQALEEVQQYRNIGTVEECLKNKDFLDFLSDKMNPNDFETYLRLYNALEEKGCEE